MCKLRVLLPMIQQHEPPLIQVKQCTVIEFEKDEFTTAMQRQNPQFPTSMRMSGCDIGSQTWPPKPAATIVLLARVC
jgi:hypothetical protein